MLAARFCCFNSAEFFQLARETIANQESSLSLTAC